ncbi:MAG: hypothetical protein PHY93_18800 [Bacteriovorax sp.]|nr:hypothetical protein [Bacteriovorax sp.]
MKHMIVILIISTLSFGLKAEEIRTFNKLNASQAEVIIQTEETDATQAAMYVDGKENEQFIKMLLQDKTSDLARLKAKIELDNCDQNSTDENPWITGCGEVTITSEVKTAFGRGGWMSGSANYTFFVGFTEDGSGRFFEATYMVKISEDAEAQVNGDFKYNGIIKKYLSFDKISALPIE